MIDFIVQFRTEILIVIEILLVVVFWFLRKPPTTIKTFKILNESDRIESLINECITYYIRLAEETITGGREKLAFVVYQIMERIRKFIPDSNYSYWISLIVDRVEAILSTPQKKGDL